MKINTEKFLAFLEQQIEVYEHEITEYIRTRNLEAALEAKTEQAVFQILLESARGENDPMSWLED